MTTSDRRQYLCFTPDTSPDLARARFGERFGAQPERVYLDAGMLWAGPVPGQGKLFDDTATLPLFSGVPMAAQVETFDPPASVSQAALPGVEIKLR